MGGCRINGGADVGLTTSDGLNCELGWPGGGVGDLDPDCGAAACCRAASSSSSCSKASSRRFSNSSASSNMSSAVPGAVGSTGKDKKSGMSSESIVFDLFKALSEIYVRVKEKIRGNKVIKRWGGLKIRRQSEAQTPGTP